MSQTKQCNPHIFSLIALAFMLVFPTIVKAQTEITSLSEITNSSGNYIIKQDISGGAPGVTTFSGTLEARIDPATKMPYRIKNLNAPLFTKLTGTVKNLVIENVSISQLGVVGAIADTANGAARIYNVGILTGNVGSTTTSGETSTGCCGGLVGLLDGTARVVNCYSYANITGGNCVGGIVGYNNVATASNNLKTMVFGCMFYGDITGGANKAPIYNGTNISNKDSKGVSNFNYFRAEASYVQDKQINTYNCALMAETRFLQRFEFFRPILNGHRKVAAWWVTGNQADTALVMKWVMIPDSIGTSHPYPILKKWGKYPSVVNFDVVNATTGKLRNQGGKLGTLDVHIQMGTGGAQFGPPVGATITKADTTLVITDKDTSHFNFNYYKVQLPYYNDVGSNNYRKASDGSSRVVTGWKIVDINGGTEGTYSTGWDVEYNSTTGEITKIPYNFADRNCTNKDLYGEGGSNRVFNQGAYWDVPEGVTAITIEPYWAKAAYVTDSYADVVYNEAMSSANNVSNVGGGQIYTNGNEYPIAGENQKVYTSISNAIASTALNPNTSHTVNDYAVVLVGNYHQLNGIEASKPYTVTTIDLDHDNEPDYAFILRFNGRMKFHPVKYDFVDLVGLGMAQKSTGGKGTYNFGIPQPTNWFEFTNTALFRVTQMEYEGNRSANQPIILHGGVIEQWVSGQSTVNDKTIYFHVGGNVWFKEFHLGCHQDKSDKKTKHPPVSVTGGDFDSFYLTGLYATTINYDDNAECYINGGRFGTVAGTGMEGIGNASTHANGNITWLIDNADIKEFFAGGINDAKPAEGNINTFISNSHVDFFCGGPKFGDMNTGRKVKTTANNCTFGFFFGAGYGGNSYYPAAPGNFTDPEDPWDTYNLDWDKWVKGEIKGKHVNNGNYSNGVVYNGYRQQYISQFGGVATAIDYQFLSNSSNTYNVGRLFLKFVKFSLATTRSITSTLKGCTIDSSFYGGGSLGKVDGPVVSVLDSCTVKGNVFGAGYSATLPSIPVMHTGGFAKQPYYDTNLGAYLKGDFLDADEYTWVHVDEVTAENAISTDTLTLATSKDLSNTSLGAVSGKVTLTLKGNTTVGTLQGGILKPKTGNVYGGGDESAVNNSTTVILEQGATVYGNIYGGGNNGIVSGNSEVKIQN